MQTETHRAADLLTGPTFYDFDHFIDIEGVSYKVVAVHGGDTSTAHYWKDRAADDILLSVRPVTRFGLGDQIKHMVTPTQKLTARAVA